MSFKRPDTLQEVSHWARLLYSPGAVIHIGAGIGTGSMAFWRQWAVPHALQIDAIALPQHAQKQVGAEPENWHIRQALLSDINGEARFYIASNPAENGLLPTETLTQLWPNLRNIEQTDRLAQRLDRLLGEPGFEALCAAQHKWLLIECLPALKILRGAGAQLDSVSVVALRVLLQPLSAELSNVAPHTLQDCSLTEAEDYLTPLGFKVMHVAETNHPAIGEVLFVRDWAAVFQVRLSGVTARQEAMTVELEQQKILIDVLQTEKAELVGLREHLNNRNDQLAAAYELQIQLNDALQSQIETLQTEQADHASRMKVLMQAREKLIQSQESIIQKIDGITQERDLLAAEKTVWAEEKSELTLACDREALMANERRSQLEQLEVKAQEAEYRNQLLSQEIIKAEAQIELIKDVLFRESAL